MADSLTGQDAVKTAKAFHERLPLTGLVLTRTDGDGRGGAALSMRHVTGLPIKFLGAGREDRRAGGVRRPAGGGPHPRPGRRGRPGREGRRRRSTTPRPEKAAKKFAKGQFDLDDLAMQLKPDAEDGRHAGHPRHAAGRAAR